MVAFLGVSHFNIVKLHCFMNVNVITFRFIITYILNYNIYYFIISKYNETTLLYQFKLSLEREIISSLFRTCPTALCSTSPSLITVIKHRCILLGLKTINQLNQFYQLSILLINVSYGYFVNGSDQAIIYQLKAISLFNKLLDVLLHQIDISVSGSAPGTSAWGTCNYL